LRYLNGKPVPRAEGAPTVDVCEACGESTHHDSTGASLRYTPYLRPRNVGTKRSRRRNPAPE
jgi:hypothetical protein